MAIATNSFSVYFYLAIIIPIIMIGLTIIFIKKLRYDYKKILKSVWVSLLITIIIQILFLIIIQFLPQPLCSIGKGCVNNTEIALTFFPYTFPLIFLIVIFIYYIIKMIKRA